ncbi:hypothetical protein O7A70_31510 [Mesorhizobium sp. Cs1299R1N1]|uniref:hypothetical protein n=1 Tax=Mesorhizobium sp. Cs1299R1N1 TaxID=3015172 RepID=UPI00301C4C16
MKICDCQDERFSNDMRKLIVSAFKLVSDGLGEPQCGRAEEYLLPFGGHIREGRVDVIVRHLRIGGDGLDSGLVAEAIRNMEIRGFKRLFDKQPLLAK